jgi:hypothetical protein
MEQPTIGLAHLAATSLERRMLCVHLLEYRNVICQLWKLAKRKE